MQESDAGEFATLIAALAAAFGKEADEAMQLGYWMGLEDLPLADVRAAVGKAIRGGKYMPAPSELRSGSGVLTPASRAVIAFDAVGRAIRAHGHRASVDFDDPLINAAVRNLGGWGRVCSMPPEEFEKWYRKDFTAVYTALCESGATADACRYLPGLDEAENASRGPQLLRDGSRFVVEPKRIATALPPHEGGRVLRLVSGK